MRGSWRERNGLRWKIRMFPADVDGDAGGELRHGGEERRGEIIFL